MSRFIEFTRHYWDTTGADITQRKILVDPSLVSSIEQIGNLVQIRCGGDVFDVVGGLEEVAKKLGKFN